jgi:membrane protein DedA with SNARE-associated domain
MFESFVEIMLNFTENMGYLGVFILMTIQSSFIPFPSEIVIPPAAYLASKGQFNIYLIAFVGLLGSFAGAIINYFLAYYLGRTVIYELAGRKWARLLLINKKNIERSEKFFEKYGNISTFLGRLVPGIRQLISLAAGFTKMNFWKFLLYTGLGSGIWVSILAYLGYAFGEKEGFLTIATAIAVALVAIFVFFYYLHIRKARRKS